VLDALFCQGAFALIPQNKVSYRQHRCFYRVIPYGIHNIIRGIFVQGKFQQECEQPSFEQCWERVKQKTGLKTQHQLASLVGITQSYVSKMKNENVFPPEWAYFISKKFNLSMDWILTGDCRDQFNSRIDDHFDFNILKEINTWLKSLVVQEPQRVDWFAISFQDCFPMFREWKKRKEKEEGRDNIDPQSNVA
jgi:transcriptional regulator with XRE-family HTH domain